MCLRNLFIFTTISYVKFHKNKGILGILKILVLDPNELIFVGLLKKFENSSKSGHLNPYCLCRYDHKSGLIARKAR